MYYIAVSESGKSRPEKGVYNVLRKDGLDMSQYTYHGRSLFPSTVDRICRSHCLNPSHPTMETSHNVCKGLSLSAQLTRSESASTMALPLSRWQFVNFSLRRLGKRRAFVVREGSTYGRKRLMTLSDISEATMWKSRS